jgi:hypothetical protein
LNDRQLDVTGSRRKVKDQIFESGPIDLAQRTVASPWSGHTQRLIRWFTDCDRDTLLFEVEQRFLNVR